MIYFVFYNNHKSNKEDLKLVVRKAYKLLVRLYGYEPEDILSSMFWMTKAYDSGTGWIINGCIKGVDPQATTNKLWVLFQQNNQLFSLAEFLYTLKELEIYVGPKLTLFDLNNLDIKEDPKEKLNYFTLPLIAPEFFEKDIDVVLKKNKTYH